MTQNIIKIEAYEYDLGRNAVSSVQVSRRFGGTH
jgi:hypothetical protein